MPSPFPGMNPYLEQQDVWHDFHQTFVPAAREFLTRQGLAHYFGSVDFHLIVTDPVDVEKDNFLELRDVASNDLVTVMELLSPPDKVPGPRREQYLATRLEVLSRPVNLVEIDLLRGGQRLPPDA